jgi:hypothetical protein
LLASCLLTKVLADFLGQKLFTNFTAKPAQQSLYNNVTINYSKKQNIA